MAEIEQVTVWLASGFEQFAVALVKSVHSVVSNNVAVELALKLTITVVPEGNDASSSQAKEPITLSPDEVSYLEEISE